MISFGNIFLNAKNVVFSDLKTQQKLSSFSSKFEKIQKFIIPYPINELSFDFKQIENQKEENKEIAELQNYKIVLKSEKEDEVIINYEIKENLLYITYTYYQKETNKILLVTSFVHFAHVCSAFVLFFVRRFLFFYCSHLLTLPY